MSDEQLRALMASNTASLEAQNRTGALIAELRASQADLRASQAETGAQMAQTDAQLEKTIKGIADLRKQTGHFINNDSLSDEEYFYRTMEAHPQLGNIVFDDVQRNMQLKNYDPEFDLVLFNDEVHSW